MSYPVFLSRLTSLDFSADAILDISNGGKALVLSDLHMGAGKRDDLDHNGELSACLLEDYFKNGWNLVLNGDIEDVQRHSLEKIQKKWTNLFRVFDLFAGVNRLYKIIGNHDEELLLRRAYPYPLYTAIKIETGVIPAFVYHGHQLSKIYVRYKNLIGAAIRYILKPFGIKNIFTARSPYKRFYIEKQAYAFSLKNHCLSIIGHTHRPLFASLGRFDYIKFEIERLCRDYPASSGADRTRIENEVASLRRELGKLKRKERRDVLRQSLYGDELTVPCLFNSGCALGKKGLSAIEITDKDIALVYWFTEGKGKPFVSRGSYKIQKLPGMPHRRVVLNQDKLDYILAKIKLMQ
ncbi:MAG: serine/threonine protein phosphatase [Treponema sp.]|jgi:UDP-2,3-diacylglucosamine pyrophosphatase LpxH|nr:serine/threonine protein phosphatase [Treponema sp.]